MLTSLCVTLRKDFAPTWEVLTAVLRDLESDLSQRETLKQRENIIGGIYFENLQSKGL